jgi:hypothetical protein
MQEKRNLRKVSFRITDDRDQRAALLFPKRSETQANG